MISILLGQQNGCTKCPLFFYVFETLMLIKNTGSRKDGHNEMILKLEKRYLSFSISQQVLLHLFHVKLKIMQQFVEALSKETDCFWCLCHKFHASSSKKLRSISFDGPQI